MGNKGNWIRTVKKAFGSSSNGSGSKEIGEEEIKVGKSKSKWYSKKKSSKSTTVALEIPPTQPPPQIEAVAVSEKETVEDHTKSNNLTEVNLSTSTSTRTHDHDQAETNEATETVEPPVELLVATVDPEQVRADALSVRFPGKSKEDIAAIIIQTAFRGYTAKRALRVLRGLVRLKKIMQGPAIKRQTGSTLKSMQTLAWIQAQIRAQRVRMSEENQARQQQLLSKQAKELEKSKQIQNRKTSTEGGGDWDLSRKSKDQIQERNQSKHDAIVRREKAMAYSFNHQQSWRSTTTARSAHTLYIESTNPHWGWTWLERWLADRPWETANARDAANPALAALRISNQDNKTTPVGGGSLIAKALLYHVNSEKPTPSSSTASTPKSARASRNKTAARISTSNPRSSTSRKFSPRKERGSDRDDDARSMRSDQTSRGRGRRRLSFDTESLASVTSLGSTSVLSSTSSSSRILPKYMAPTESAKARSSRLGDMSSAGSTRYAGSADRLSFSSGNGKKKASRTSSSPSRSMLSASSNADANSPAG